MAWTVTPLDDPTVAFRCAREQGLTAWTYAFGGSDDFDQILAFVVTNSGGLPVTVGVTSAHGYITAASHAVGAGDDWEFDLTPAAAANALVAGIYADTLTFDDGAGNTITRHLQLEIAWREPVIEKVAAAVA